MAKAQTNQALILQRQKEALADMNPALRAAYDEIKAKVVEVEQNRILVLYDVGEIVKKISRDETTYGTAAVETLALALGGQWSANQLYELRSVTHAFTRGQAEKLTQRPMSDGGAITLTHLILLARAKPEHRKELTNRTISASLSTRELHDALQAKLGGQRRGTSTGRKPTPPKSIAGGLSQIARYPKEVQNRIKIWDKHVFKEIDNLSSDACDDSLLQLLNVTREAEQQAIADSQHLLSQLDDAIEKVTTTISKKAAAASANGNGNGKPTTKKVVKKKPTKKPTKKAAKKEATKKKQHEGKIAAAKARRKAMQPSPA